MRSSILVIALIGNILLGFGQSKQIEDVSIDRLLEQTQYSSDSADLIEMVWWLPEVFWEVSFSQDPSSSQADVDALQELLSGTELFIVIKGKIGMFGGITYTPLEDILSTFSVKYDSKNLVIIPEDELGPDFLNFLGIMKPMMSNMMGAMGENLHFIVMKDNEESHVLPIDPYGNKELTFTLSDFSSTVDLPLGCLLLEKRCPVDNASLSGKWNYCPIHGKVLLSK